MPAPFPARSGQIYPSTHQLTPVDAGLVSPAPRPTGAGRPMPSLDEFTPVDAGFSPFRAQEPTRCGQIQPPTPPTRPDQARVVRLASQ